MKEHPILFSGPMVRAILEGRKTQTRRVVKPQTRINLFENGQALTDHGWLPELDNPYGDIGTRLWVRETFNHEQGCPIHYRADYLDDPHGPDGEKSPEGKYRTWKPSIFMRRNESRLNLEITGVRVERLQEISRGDAMSEGCPFQNMATGPDPRKWFSKLWEEINGKKHPWESNPFCWVISFRRISQ